MRRYIIVIVVVLLLVGLALGAVTYMLLGDIATQYPQPVVQPTEQEIPTVEVIVALQTIRRGTEFIEGSFGRRPWPAANVPPDSVTDETELTGKVANIDLIQGQIIVRSMLVALEWDFPTPTVANGVAYFGRNDGYLYALDIITGQEVWRFELLRPIFSKPAVSGGRVFILDEAGTLYAVNAETGQELWRIVGVNPPRNLDVADPTVIDGVVYFDNRSDERFYAIDAKTGEEKWRIEGGAQIIGDQIYYVASSGMVTEIDPKTGQPLGNLESQSD